MPLFRAAPIAIILATLGLLVHPFISSGLSAEAHGPCITAISSSPSFATPSLAFSHACIDV